MKAMVLQAPGQLRAAEVERPKPDRNEVLVRVTNSGICGTDLKIFDGAIPVHYPLIMGHEMIGELVEGGDAEIPNGSRVIVDPATSCGACSNCRAGQTSLCPNGGLVGRDTNGGFADYLVAPRSHVYALPDSIDSQSAPLIQVATTCMHAHRLVNIFPGQSVVVVGMGVTGQLHAQLAKAWGAYPVIGLTRSAWKRNLAESLGTDITLPTGADGVKGVMEATKGRGADLIIESTGIPAAISDSVSMARLGGSIILFGVSAATQVNLPFYQLYFKELKIVNTRAAKGEDFPASIDLAARGVLKLKPLITHVVPLPELESAIGMLVKDEDKRMKIIMENVA